MSVVADAARPLIFEVAMAADALMSELVMSSDNLLCAIAAEVLMWSFVTEPSAGVIVVPMSLIPMTSSLSADTRADVRVRVVPLTL